MTTMPGAAMTRAATAATAGFRRLFAISGIAAVVSVGAMSAGYSFTFDAVGVEDAQAIETFLETATTRSENRLPSGRGTMMIVQTRTSPTICRDFVINLTDAGQTTASGCRTSSGTWGLADGNATLGGEPLLVPPPGMRPAGSETSSAPAVLVGVPTIEIPSMAMAAPAIGQDASRQRVLLTPGAMPVAPGPATASSTSTETPQAVAATQPATPTQPATNPVPQIAALGLPIRPESQQGGATGTTAPAPSASAPGAYSNLVPMQRPVANANTPTGSQSGGLANTDPGPAPDQQNAAPEALAGFPTPLAKPPAPADLASPELATAPPADNDGNGMDGRSAMAVPDLSDPLAPIQTIPLATASTQSAIAETPDLASTGPEFRPVPERLSAFPQPQSKPAS